MTSRVASLDLEQTYLSRRHELIRFLESFGVCAGEAEDIAQDAFLRAVHPSAGAARPENPFRWLLVCAKNLAINRYKRNRRYVLFDASAWKACEATLADAQTDMESQVHRKELLSRVRRALKHQLTPIERSCLVLRSRGSTYREVADSLNISMDRAVYLTGAAINKVHGEIQGVL